MQKAKKWILAILCLLAVLLLYLFVFSRISPADILAILAPFGAWAAVLYILLFTLLPVFFFPVAVLALAGGLLFGLLWGSVYTFVGAILNCLLMFQLSRTVGRRRVNRLVRKRLSSQWQQRLQNIDGRQGFWLLILLRLIPAVPYNLINYSFGLTPMPFGAYLLGSVIGIIPGTLVFINLGDKAIAPASLSFWIAIALLVLLLAVTALLGKKLFPPTLKNGEYKHESI